MRYRLLPSLRLQSLQLLSSDQTTALTALIIIATLMVGQVVASKMKQLVPKNNHPVYQEHPFARMRLILRAMKLDGLHVALTMHPLVHRINLLVRLHPRHLLCLQIRRFQSPPSQP